MIRTASGDLWSTGNNHNSQLGIPRISGATKFTQVTCFPSVRQFSCGELHVLVVDEDNNLYSIGTNSYGQAGREKASGSVEQSKPFPPTLLMENVDCVLASRTNSFVVDQTGIVYACGNNRYGQLASGHNVRV